MPKHAPGFIQNPDHKVKISAYSKLVTVHYQDTLIALSKKALKVEESGFADVLYIPISDIYTAYLRESTHSSYCPFKGLASYHSFEVEGQFLENGAWFYDNPFLECEQLKGHLAFYSNKVSLTFHD